MKKYIDIDHDRIWTENELREEHKRLLKEDFSEEEKEIYSNFGYWLNVCTDKNGSLEPIADDWLINKLQRNVANDIACSEMPYDDCLRIVQNFHMFEHWTEYEIYNRPVDIEAIREAVEQCLL